jgi:putative transposase
MFIEPKSGNKYRWNERAIEVDGKLGPGSVSARDCSTGEQLVIPASELRSPATAVLIKRPGVVPQAEWDQAKLVRGLLEPYVNTNRVPKTVLQDAAKRCGRSVRQMRRYLAALRGTPLTTALVPKIPGRKAHSRLLSADVERVVIHCIRKYYLRREPMSVREVSGRIGKMCRRISIKPPRYKTVLRRVQAWDGREMMRLRRGSKAANQRYEAKVGTLTVKRPLDLVQLDHTRVDVHIVSADAFREWLGRPWLTVCIDVYSRCVLGFYLSIDAPSSLSMAVCISQAVLPKERWLKDRALEMVPWPMYGLPKKILTDNAAEFLGTAAARGCEQLGIVLEHRPVARPHWGGHVERLIGTLMGRVHCIPGTSFSNIKDRQDYDSTKKACMTLAELEEWLTYEICLNYHVTKHRAIGVSPLEKWNLGMSTDIDTAKEV